MNLRHAARGLIRAPSFALPVVLTLGLALGANATVFTWLENLVLNPYPAVREPGRLVVLNTAGPEGNGWPIAWPVFQAWRREATTLEGMAAWVPARVGVRSRAQESTEPAWAMLVSGDYFDVLGINLPLGRGFRPEEEASRAPVVILSDSYWRRHFGGDLGVLGQNLRVGDADLTIIGVAPAGFAGTYVGVAMDFWLPLTLHRSVGVTRGSLDDRSVRWLQGVGRRQPGVSLTRVKAELDQVARAESEAAGDRPVLTALVRLPRQQFLGDLVFPLFSAMLAVTGVILLAACANIANLLLARAGDRARELAVRTALGAGRRHLVRHLLAESALLSLFGAGLALAIVWLARGSFAAFVPPMAYQLHVPMALNGRVLTYTALVTAIAVAIFGLFPAWRAGRTDPAWVLRDNGGDAIGRSRLRAALVVSQMALSVISLVLAGLFIRSMQAAERVPLGFQAPGRILLATTELALGGIPDSSGPALLESLLERVGGMPGVRSVTAAGMVPLGFGGFRSVDTRIEGYLPGVDEPLGVRRVAVGPGYFRTLGIGISAGREFNRGDRSNNLPVAVVSEGFAHRYWPDQDPLGRRVDQGDGWRTVIGVVRDIKVQSLDDQAVPVVYVPLLQSPAGVFTLHLRTDGPPLLLAPALRAIVRQTHADLPLLEVRSLEEHIGAATFTQRLGGGVLTALGALALLLAGGGVFGVMACAVTQRRREMGVRLALGEPPRRLRRAIVGQALRLSALGVLLGSAAAAGLGRLVQSQLIGVGTTDPVTYAAVTLALLGVGAAAAWIPARRACRVDPLQVLRDN